MFDARCYTHELHELHESHEFREDCQVTESLIEHVRLGLNKVFDGGIYKPVVLSLSGGVDSMVLFDIFKKLEIDFHCVHIDYANRPESEDEAKYLQSYCYSELVPLTIYRMPIKRDDKEFNRQEYESLSKEHRFMQYDQVCQSINTNIVCLGHHDDDVIENIITNILQNQSLGDLGKMHLEGAGDHSLNIVRLFIGKMKSTLYRYAEENKIFYFKDSTPKWSKRGKIRDKVLPQLEDLFSNAKEQLLRFNNINSSNSRILHKLLQNYLNFIITTKDDGTRVCRIPGNLYNDCPYLLHEIGFWKMIISEATKKLDGENISQKSIENFIHNIERKRVILSKNIQIENDEGRFSLARSP